MRFALLAQLVEQRAFNPWALGSSPKGRTYIYGRIVAVLYTDINHVIGVCGFESHRPY